jgi:hypothetical protein
VPPAGPDTAQRGKKLLRRDCPDRTVADVGVQEALESRSENRDRFRSQSLALPLEPLPGDSLERLRSGALLCLALGAGIDAVCDELARLVRASPAARLSVTSG